MQIKSLAVSTQVAVALLALAQSRLGAPSFLELRLESLVEAGVVEAEGDLVGQRLEGLDVDLVERVGGPLLDVEHTQDSAGELDRHREFGAGGGPHPNPPRYLGSLATSLASSVSPLAAAAPMSPSPIRCT